MVTNHRPEILIVENNCGASAAVEIVEVIQQ